MQRDKSSAAAKADDNPPDGDNAIETLGGDGGGDGALLAVDGDGDLPRSPARGSGGKVGRPRKTDTDIVPPRTITRSAAEVRLEHEENRGLAAIGLNRLRKQTETRHEELNALLASLNFDANNYEVRVTRLEPDVDENGVPCDGWLHTYRKSVTVDQIGQRFGGGVYEIVVMGPHEVTGKITKLKEEPLRIAGHPKPMPSSKDNGKDGAGEVLRAITESNERNQTRVMEVLERTQSSSSGLVEILPALAPLLEKLFSKNDDATKAMIEMQREERKAEEERRREDRDERRRDEDRKRDEAQRAEDRRREEARDEAQRRRDEEKRADEDRRQREREDYDRRKEERETERARLQLEQTRVIEAMKAEAAEKQRQHERDLQAQKDRLEYDRQRERERADDDRRRNQEYVALMQTQMDAIAQRSESGGLKAVTEQLLMLKRLQGTLTGDDAEPTTFEKFQEGFSNMAQTILPVAQSFMTQRKEQQATARAQVQQQPQQQWVPPKPVVMDLGPARAALPPAQQGQPQPGHTGLPPMPQVNADEVFRQATEQPNPAPQDQAAQDANDLKALAIPAEGGDMMTDAILLIKNADLAVQMDMTAEQIVQSIIVPFENISPLLMSMVGGMNSDQLMQFIEENVPPEWAILSPKGDELITKAFEQWQDAKEGAGAA